MKKIYILLSRTGTWMSNVVHAFTKGDYSHVSISLVPSTDSFYSYARLKPNNPVVAGLIKEDLRTGTFKRFEEGYCELFELEISDESYEKIKAKIEDFWAVKKKCKYNLCGTVCTALNIEWERKYRFNCSQFTASLLHYSGAATLPRKPSLMRPMDYLELKGIRSIYKGKIKDCVYPLPSLAS